MRNPFVIAALAALLSAGTIGAASALPAVNPAANVGTGAPVELAGQHGHKFKNGRHFILPKHVIVRSLHRRGFRHIRHVRLRHGDYVLLARGFRGPVRLVVDGRTARILSRKPLFGGHQPGFSLKGNSGNFSYSFGFR